MKQHARQTTVFKHLINELVLKQAVTYTFTGFLALAGHGRISGRFRASQQEQTIEINVTGNASGPLQLQADLAGLQKPEDQALLLQVQRDLDEASSFLDSML